MDKQNFLKILGANIRYYREVNHMSQEELANKCGYKTANARSTISKIETGNSDLPVSKLKIMADLFGIKPTDLMGMSREHTKSCTLYTPCHDTQTDKVVRKYLALSDDNRELVNAMIDNMHTISNKTGSSNNQAM